jgi:hypothetical protein
MTNNYYVVKGGKQQWLARMHDPGTSEDIAQLWGHEIKQLVVSADGTSLASRSFYQGKTRAWPPRSSKREFWKAFYHDVRVSRLTTTPLTGISMT